jgi:hypothetical protein
VQTNPVQQVVEFINQNSGLILAVLTVVLYALKDYNVLKQLLTSIFLDVEKRFAEQATAGGHDKIEAAIQDALNLIPKRFDVALTIVAFVLGSRREELAHTIAQFVYDRIRAQVQPPTDAAKP